MRLPRRLAWGGIRGVAREERTGDPGALMKPTPESSTQEVLAGLVERVTFHNAENGFCVLRAKARGHRDLVTVVGHAAIISAGEWITASGEWINDRAHGQQFKARFLKTSAPSSIDGIEKYLGCSTARSISAWLRPIIHTSRWPRAAPFSNGCRSVLPTGSELPMGTRKCCLDFRFLLERSLAGAFPMDRRAGLVSAISARPNVTRGSCAASTSTLSSPAPTRPIGP